MDECIYTRVNYVSHHQAVLSLTEAANICHNNEAMLGAVWN